MPGYDYEWICQVCGRRIPAGDGHAYCPGPPETPRSDDPPTPKPDTVPGAGEERGAYLALLIPLFGLQYIRPNLPAWAHVPFALGMGLLTFIVLYYGRKNRSLGIPLIIGLQVTGVSAFSMTAENPQELLAAANLPYVISVGSLVLLLATLDVSRLFKAAPLKTIVGLAVIAVLVKSCFFDQSNTPTVQHTISPQNPSASKTRYKEQLRSKSAKVANPTVTAHVTPRDSQ